ncbi:MAG: hypothetical protein ACI9XO_003040 [Paraglaciecola sp.]|jgi:hypothetical protein
MKNEKLRMKKHLLNILIFSLMLLGQGTIYAQFPGGGGGGLGSTFSGGSGSSGTQKLVQDTSAIYHFYAKNPNLIYPYLDSLLTNFQQYDPIRQQRWDWGHLGNLGSAARPLVYTPQYRQGVDIGLHQYDLYQLRTEDVKFYKIRQTFSQGYFSQGANQGNGYFKVRFSRTFAKGLNLSIEHRRINDAGYYDNEGVDNKSFALGLWYRTQGGGYDGFFTFTANNMEVQDNGGEQLPTQTVNSIDVPVWRDAFLLDASLSSANTQHLNREFAYTQYVYLNGQRKRKKKSAAPIFSDSLLLQKYDSLAALSVDTLNLEEDSLTIDSVKISLDSILILTDALKTAVSKTDTILNKKTPRTTDKTTAPTGRPNVKKNSKNKPLDGKGQRSGSRPPVFTTPPPPPVFVTDFTKKRAFTVYHRIKYQKEVYKFSDNNPATDSIYYEALQVDDRGLRYFLERKMVENVIKIQTFKLRKDKQNTRVTSQKDLIEVGLKHQMHFIDQDGVDTSALHNLYLTGAIDFTPSDRLKISTSGHLALGEHAGDYRVAGQLFFDLEKLGELQIDAVNQLYEPTFLQHRFYNTEREAWKNGFDKTLETSIVGTYSLPKFQLSINGGYHLLTNYVYFDTLTTPQQTNELISIFQLGLEKNFTLGPVHLDNQLVYQKTTSDRLRIPELYLKNSLYIEGRIFKKTMLARVGVDARMWTAYRPYTYQPLTGQFHLQDSNKTLFTPLLDAFFIFKLTRFRFFFKMENILSSFQQTYYSQTSDYLLPFGFNQNGGMRLGISWRFVD